MSARSIGGGEAATRRLRVAYRCPERLLAEVARWAHRCGTLRARNPLPRGTVLSLELTATGVREPVEILAKVLSVAPLDDGTYRLEVAFQLGRRGGLDEAVYRILQTKATEPMRRAPRLPVDLDVEGLGPEAGCRLRDLSLTGAGFDLAAGSPPRALAPGAPALLEIALAGGERLSLPGAVAWVWLGPPRRGVARGFAVELEELDLDRLDALDRLLFLRTTPRGARLLLGAAAFDASAPAQAPRARAASFGAGWELSA